MRRSRIIDVKPIDNQRQSSPRSVADPNSLLECSACLRVAFNAWETPHGCRLCGCCHGCLLDLECGQPCPGQLPTCHTATCFRRSDCLEDAVSRAELAVELVYCTNVHIGCGFTGQFQKLADHLALSCQFGQTKCLRCGWRLTRRNLAEHQLSDECRQFIFDKLGNYGGR